MEELLITAVFKRKALWDPADERRKNSRILKSLWAGVAKELGVDVKAAKSKWKNLRSYFMSQSREIDKLKSERGENARITCSWKFYNQLLFLRDISACADVAWCDSLASTIEQTENNEFDEESVVNTLDLYTDTISVFALPENPAVSRNHTQNEKPIFKTEEDHFESEKYVDFHARRSSNKKRKLSTGTVDVADSGEILEIERRKVQLLEREINAEENSDLLFFKSLLPYIQEFTPIQKLRIRSKIQNLILEESVSLYIKDDLK